MERANQEVEKLDHIFAGEFDPQEAGKRLLEVLCLPGGMEAFVRDHNGKLHFSSVSVDEHPGFLVYSSMTSEGRFVSEEGGYVLVDKTGRQTPCYTMALDATIGEAVKNLYNDWQGLK